MTPTAYVQLVENKLGWQAPFGPEHVRYQSEARKVSLKISTDPELYTWRNLELAVEYLRRQKITRSPVGVFHFVPTALQLGVEVETDLEDRIREVVNYEVKRGDPDGWADRFARCTGIHRGEAYDEWCGRRG